MKTVTKSSKLKIKNFSNTEKFNTLFSLLNESICHEINKMTNDMIYQDKISIYSNKTQTEHLPFESSWIRQLIFNEASSQARSIKNKLRKIKLNSNLKKYQQELLEKYNSKELKINWKGNLNLDSRFLKIEDSKDSSFDYWISFKWKGVDRFYIPFKKNKHIQNLLNRGFILKRNTLKICQNGNIILSFQKEVSEKTDGDVIGIDVGRNKSFVTSRNETESETKEILNSLKRKKHGSKNKARHVRRLKQTIDKTIKNNIEWNTVLKVILENLTGMKSGMRRGNINHHWSYSYIQDRIKQKSAELGVQVKQISGAYTSQDCSRCGFRYKNNRKSEKFLCLSCENEMDADLNASLNIRNRGLINNHDQRKHLC